MSALAARGSASGTVAVIVRQEIVLAIMGGVCRRTFGRAGAPTLKFTGGKRIFRMALLHHHYELWGEETVVVRFWIITMMLIAVRVCQHEMTLIMLTLKPDGQRSCLK